MGRRAFVTGASGFIGRFLIDELSDHGWSVRALVRQTSDTRHLRERGVELSVGDLTDPASLLEAIAAADTVFHLAAVTAARGEGEYRDTNEAGTHALVAAAIAARPAPRRLVYLSSYAAGGPATLGRPRSCSEEPMPLTAYGRTKLAGEVAARFAATSGMEVTVLRAPVVYGPGDRALLPFFRLIRWGLAPAPGGGDRRLHLVFAPDLARALRRAADAPPDLYAVADPVEHLWGDIARTIGAGLERRPIAVPLPPLMVKTAAAVTESLGRLAGRATAFNREKAQEMLAPAWVCDLAGSETLLPLDDVTPLREGIDHTISWYIRQGWL